MEIKNINLLLKGIQPLIERVALYQTNNKLDAELIKQEVSIVVWNFLSDKQSVPRNFLLWVKGIEFDIYKKWKSEQEKGNSLYCVYDIDINKLPELELDKDNDGFDSIMMPDIICMTTIPERLFVLDVEIFARKN